MVAEEEEARAFRGFVFALGFAVGTIILCLGCDYWDVLAVLLAIFVLAFGIHRWRRAFEVLQQKRAEVARNFTC